MNTKIIECFKLPNFSFTPFNISKKNRYFIETLHYYYSTLKIPVYQDSFKPATKVDYGLYYQHIPDNIFKYISKQTYHKHLIQFVIHKRRISLHFFTTTKISKKIIENVIHIISFLSYFASSKCSNILDIYIFSTPFKKEISTIDDHIGSKDINTAYTYACIENNVIYIYRKEEWKKVLIHECMHAFGIDFSTIETQNNTVIQERLKSIFKLNIRYNMNEAFTETFATLINNIQLFHNNQISKKELIPFMEENLKNEIIHSLVQTNKYLKQSQLSLRHLLYGKDNSFYNENTSAFAYYFIKCVFIYNINAFLSVTYNINSYSLKSKFTSENIVKYIDLIEKKVKSNNFKRDIHNSEKLIQQCPLLHKSLKFSFYG